MASESLFSAGCKRFTLTPRSSLSITLYVLLLKRDGRAPCCPEARFARSTPRGQRRQRSEPSPRWKPATVKVTSPVVGREHANAKRASSTLFDFTHALAVLVDGVVDGVLVAVVARRRSRCGTVVVAHSCSCRHRGWCNPPLRARRTPRRRPCIVAVVVLLGLTAVVVAVSL